MKSRWNTKAAAMKVASHLQPQAPILSRNWELSRTNLGWFVYQPTRRCCSSWFYSRSDNRTQCSSLHS
ncbi:hypothetical protein NPIL_132851 [Nephila pilipes]|uniref:Uncharacterized protein n=1 Tax=Nephila pilipes TaxID=299642 RepID=A0A8X6NXG9_NEPPI|nr:hypothetical protein NPIL_132851 [Nephila pilipes]